MASVIQMEVRPGRVEDNLARALAGVRAAAGWGSNLVLLPEMFTCGFDNENLAAHAGASERALSLLSEAAAGRSVMICGSLPEVSGGKIYNTAVAIGPDGRVLCRYRKIHLFRPTEEDRYFGAGESPGLFPTPWGKVGIMTCYDLRFPELARSLCAAGAAMLLVPAQWPSVRIRHWEVLLAARAVENQVFVIGANACGKSGDLLLGGRSALLSPWGRILKRAGARPARLSARLDMDEVERARKAVPVWEDRRPAAYGKAGTEQ
ncbi:MAG: carbon-nitrogen family hydrolase [Thermodesulfobacteriota bacterium]